MSGGGVTWICLAAGRGSRLRPLTDDRPKAMVTVAGRPLIEWLVRTARSAGIDDLVVVTGYRAEMIEDLVDGDVRTYHNPEYETTEMVESLWCAADALEGTVVISYSDILYTPAVLEAVLEAPHDVAVVVDEDWQSYWEARHEDPVDDAESLRMDESGQILSIGQPVESLDEPSAQYVGMVKLSPTGVERFKTAYQDRARPTDSSRQTTGAGRSSGLHMTDLLQSLVRSDEDVHAAPIQGGWVEIDTPHDLELARDCCTSAADATIEINR